MTGYNVRLRVQMQITEYAEISHASPLQAARQYARQNHLTIRVGTHRVEDVAHVWDVQDNTGTPAGELMVV